MKAEHWAYIGIGITCLFFLATCDGCEDVSDNEMYEYEQSSGDSYEQSYLSFSDEQDVRSYLCSHRFSSNDGYTLRFSNNANEISMNGKPLSSYVEIRSVSSSSATIRSQGPYGNTTFHLTISGSECVLEDTNDGTCYYSK